MTIHARLVGCILGILISAAVSALGAPGETTPAMAPPEPAARLALRQAQQARTAATQAARHDFRFLDRTAQSGITFHSRAVEDVGKHNKPIQYDHGTGIAVADVDGDGRPDVYWSASLGGIKCGATSARESSRTSRRRPEWL